METVKSRFLERKKEKPFCRFLRSWLEGKSYDDVEVAKNLSSMVTHSLIDMQGFGKPMYRALDIEFQSKMVHSLLEGGVSVDELRELYRERFGGHIRRDKQRAEDEVMAPDHSKG